jgi:hypothetical protein
MQEALGSILRTMRKGKKRREQKKNFFKRKGAAI